MNVRRDDPAGEPVHELEPAVPVIVDEDGHWPGLALRWRGRWVHCSWSRGPGVQHLAWVLAENVQRRAPEA